MSVVLFERLREWAERADATGVYALTREEVRALTAKPIEDDFRAARWQDMATAPDEGPYRMGWGRRCAGGVRADVMALPEYVRAAQASRTAEDRLQLLIKLDGIKKTHAEALAHEESVRQQAVRVIECWCAQAETMAVYLRERELEKNGGIRMSGAGKGKA